ncbi:MAG: class A beta-lactamase, subclass A2 [Bacteroidota bacterium]
MTKAIYITSLFLLLISFRTSAQTDTLRLKMQQIISTKKADVGVSIYGIESKDTLNINIHKHYPMQSVFKFHIALAVLNQVDKGKLKITQKIYIKKSELLPDTWSPIREDYPNGDIKLTVAEIIKYTVAKSDNNGCDILLRLIGGTKIVNDYIHTIGVKDVFIRANEEAMHKEWIVQFSNWATPKSVTELLILFYTKNILSKNSFDFLWETMLATSTGKKRIKGQLPEGALVAHKTGTSGTNEQGVTAAINDIGIVTLPNGEHFTISVFVVNSKENEETNEKIISDIAKLTWDYFMHKQ